MITANKYDRVCGECQLLRKPKCKRVDFIPQKTATDTEASCCPSFLPVGYDEPQIKPEPIKDVPTISKSIEPTEIKTCGECFPDLVFELIEGNVFAIKWKDKDAIEYSDKVIHESKVYIPMKDIFWRLPPKPEDYELSSLYEDLRNFIYTYLDFADPRLYDINVCFDLASWVTEKFDTATQLYYYGPQESGKSRALEVHKELCYRPIDANLINPSGLYRLSQQFKPTLILDEFENRAFDYDTTTVLNGRYRRGQGVFRCVEKNGDYVLKRYEVFGSTVVASTSGLRSTTESRNLIYHMEKTVRKVKQLNLRHCIEADSLRARLLMYRLKNANIPRIEIDTELTDRLDEIFRPLMSVCPEDKLPVIKTFSKEISKERREAEISGTESSVIRVLQTLLVEAEAVRKAENDKAVLLGKKLKTDPIRIPTGVITDRLNMELSDQSDEWNSRSLGWLLARLGFKKGHMPDRKGTRAVLIDEKHLLRLADRFIESDISLLEPDKTSDVRNTAEKLQVSDVLPKASDVLSKPKGEDTAKSDVLTFSKSSDGIGEPRTFEPVPNLFHYGPNRKAVCSVCYLTKHTPLERIGVLAEGQCHDCGSPAELLIQLEEIT